MKALDIIKTPRGSIGIIVETNNGGTQASVDFIRGCDENGDKSAWWTIKELEIIDSLPRILASAMCHPFGSGKKDIEMFFS